VQRCADRQSKLFKVSRYCGIVWFWTTFKQILHENVEKKKNKNTRKQKNKKTCKVWMKFKKKRAGTLNKNETKRFYMRKDEPWWRQKYRIRENVGWILHD
jgi:hypothetical protein